MSRSTAGTAVVLQPPASWTRRSAPISTSGSIAGHGLGAAEHWRGHGSHGRCSWARRARSIRSRRTAARARTATSAVPCWRSTARSSAGRHTSVGARSPHGLTLMSRMYERGADEDQVGLVLGIADRSAVREQLRRGRDPSCQRCSRSWHDTARPLTGCNGDGVGMEPGWTGSALRSAGAWSTPTTRSCRTCWPRPTRRRAGRAACAWPAASRCTSPSIATSRSSACPRPGTGTTPPARATSRGLRCRAWANWSARPSSSWIRHGWNCTWTSRGRVCPGGLGWAANPAEPSEVGRTRRRMSLRALMQSPVRAGRFQLLVAGHGREAQPGGASTST